MINRQTQNGIRSGAQSGFTLIELLVVMAITSVLLFLIFGPLVQGFQLTARAQTTTQAQDAARVAMEQISREIGSASVIRDTSHQFLHLRLYQKDGTETIANAYNAYMDIVPPRAAAGVISDPTYNPSSDSTVTKQSTNGSYVLSNTDTTLPMAPGTTIVRYFIGLRYPINLNYTPGGTAQEQPYTNSDEGQGVGRSDPTFGSTQVVQNNLNNTYILYRAEVEPYTLVTKAGSPTKVAQANALYFDKDTSGNPILDDPDFFRVTANAAHNERLYHWFQAAKPIIDVGNVNLIFQAHDAEGNVAYDATTLWPAGTQADTDGNPILRTSVSFAPATISNDPMNATATSDVSQGYGTSPADLTPANYVPGQYRAQYGEWHGGPDVQITQPTGSIFNTYTYSSTTGTPPTGIQVGDLIEAMGSNNVYDISSQTPLNGSTNYIPMTVNGDDGVVDFATPDVPNATSPKSIGPNNNNVGSADYSNAANPYWFITYGQVANDPSTPITVDIKPLGGTANASTDYNLLQNASTLTGAATVPNGIVVVNSERVYGPEEDAGPGSVDPTASPSGNPVTYPLVPYRRIPFTPGADSTISADQYMIDYTNGIIHLGIPGATINMNDAYDQRRTVLVAFSYQNNNVSTATSTTADTVKATYQTGSQIEVTLGIRVYDSSDRHPTYFSLANRVGVGNSSR